MTQGFRFAIIVALFVMVAFPLSVPFASSTSAQLSLPRVFIQGGQFVDGTGRTLSLRGLVTVTHTRNGGLFSYSLEDYQRMRDMGANYQAVRIQASMIGAWPGHTANEAYLQHLDSMVAMAEQVGIYTQFKLALYDIGSTWETLWMNQNGEQDAIIDGWANLWERYKDNPAVIGYDLLNEPSQGTLGVDNKTFVETYLNPFYQDAIDALHQIDSQKFAYIQPPFEYPSYEGISIQRARVVYAPHYYPGLWRYLLFSISSTLGYEQLMSRFVLDANAHAAPLFIGEYGMPWNPEWDGDAARMADHQILERTASDLFDTQVVGFSRPYFADDRTDTIIAQYHLNWALFKGHDGLSGQERRFITDVYVRPYLRSLVGTIRSHAFDHDTKTYTLAYTTGPTSGQSEIFIPRARIYPTGFTVTFGDGTAIAYDEAAASGVQLVSNPHDLDPSIFAWDEEQQALTIQDWESGTLVELSLTASVPDVNSTIHDELREQLVIDSGNERVPDPG